MKHLHHHCLAALLTCSLLPGRVLAQDPAPASVAETAEAIHPIRAGSYLPALALQTGDGSPFSIQDALAVRPAVLIFYRGGWCPYCTVHLSALQGIAPDLQAMGYQLLAISPDRPEKLAESVANHALTYTLLSDSRMTASQALGLAFRVSEDTRETYKGYGIDLEAASGESHHLLPVPAVYIVGQDGRIVFDHVNPDYKQRLDPAAVLNAARQALPPAAPPAAPARE